MSSNGEIDFTLRGEIRKVDTDLRVAYGWMSVTSKDGQPVVDQQGDVIDIAELQKVVWEFMDTERVSAVMHHRDASGTPIRKGRFVDSIVITADLAKALGMSGDREGWFAGIQIEDQDTWNKVKSGELPMFSLSGRGVRTPIEIEVEVDDG